MIYVFKLMNIGELGPSRDIPSSCFNMSLLAYLLSVYWPKLDLSGGVSARTSYRVPMKCLNKKRVS